MSTDVASHVEIWLSKARKVGSHPSSRLHLKLSGIITPEGGGDCGLFISTTVEISLIESLSEELDAGSRSSEQIISPYDEWGT